jgi:hypothetical protein
VIAPKDAEDLATRLLDSANGWIAMRDLFIEFRQHVHLLEVVEPPSEDDAETKDSFLDRVAHEEKDRRRKLGPSHVATDEAFWMAVSQLSAKAWQALADANLTSIACQYLLANALLGRKAKLEDFGSHSTVFDQKEKAQEILRQVLSADDFMDADSEISDWHDKLWAEVLRCLAHSVEFCNLPPEKPDSGTLQKE